jgi:hypothetical protein
VGIARRYVDEQTTEYLDASAEFIRAMRREGRHSEPMVVSVDDDDERVQVYFG